MTKKKMNKEVNDEDKSIIDLLVTGKFDRQSEDAIEAAQQAIDLVKRFANSKPNVLLEIIIQISKSELVTDMLPMALAALICSSPDNYISSDKIIRNHLEGVLKDFGPGKLLQIVELIKSKVFGRGLGSSPQKLIRQVIEKWDESTIRWYSDFYPDSMKHLIKIIHPRIVGVRGDAVKRVF